MANSRPPVSADDPDSFATASPAAPRGGGLAAPHADEPHSDGMSARLNWLRAGVLGANDGIISTAGLVVGVAAATNQTGPIITAGVAGLVAGAVSMALGEYVSVSSQRDTEHALLEKERRELAEDPVAELAELADIYRRKGLTVSTARLVAEEFTALDAFAAHADAELNLDPDALTNPWHAAVASAVAFTAGALLPLIAVVVAPASIRIPVAFVVVLFALAITGSVSATLGQARRSRAVLRIVLGGALAMLVTFGIGALLGTAVA